MLTKIRDLSLSAVMLVVCLIGLAMIFDLVTQPKRQTIECQGGGIMYGPWLDLDGDMALALMKVCQDRESHRQ